MTETNLDSRFGSFDILRLPRRRRELLRAWDAADEYLLQVLAEDGGAMDHPLICNDTFGALAVSLHEFHPVSWSDSWLAHKATRENLVFNGIDVEAVECLGSLQSIDYSPELVLVKLPKNLAFLEFQLMQLKPLLKANSRVIIAGMTKVVALEVAQDNITCNAICPGYVKTPLVEKQIPDTAKARGITEEEVINDVLLTAQPTKQFTTVEQIGGVIAA